MAFRKTVFNRDIAAFNKAGFTQTAAKRISQIRALVLSEAGQETNHWNGWLLRARCGRPCRCPDPEERDEVATFQSSQLHPLPPKPKVRA